MQVIVPFLSSVHYNELYHQSWLCGVCFCSILDCSMSCEKYRLLFAFFSMHTCIWDGEICTTNSTSLDKSFPKHHVIREPSNAIGLWSRRLVSEAPLAPSTQSFRTSSSRVHVHLKLSNLHVELNFLSLSNDLCHLWQFWLKLYFIWNKYSQALSLLLQF